jgi:hypothetical protein
MCGLNALRLGWFNTCWGPVVVVVVDPATDVGVVVVAGCAPAVAAKRGGNAMPATNAATSPRRDRHNRHHLRPILAPDCVKESLEL